MKVKQIVTIKFDNVFSSYSSLDFTDVEGNEVHVRLSDDQYIELSESLTRKVERIKEDRREAQIVDDEQEEQKLV